MNGKEETTIYTVVVNQEEQYLIWFADCEPSPGWKEVGKTGSKPQG